MSIECKEVIVSYLTKRGTGVEHSPIRIITEIFEKDGTKIAEHDPSPEVFYKNDLIDFAKWLKQVDFDADKISQRTINKWLDSIKL